MRLYSKYKLEILNDKEGGSKIIAEMNKNSNSSSKMQGIIDIATDSKPTIVRRKRINLRIANENEMIRKYGVLQLFF